MSCHGSVRWTDGESEMPIVQRTKKGLTCGWYGRYAATQHMAIHKRNDHMKTSTVNLEILKEFGVAGFEAARNLGELNLRTWEKLVAKQTETFGLFIDAGIEMVKATTELKDVKALVNVEMEVAKQVGEILVTKGRETLQVTTDARDDYRSWVEQGVEVFTQQVEKSAKAA
jgi:hypothetical protein